MIKKHFVTFLSSGTFVSEQTTREIDSWDVNKAKEMARSVLERHDSTPELKDDDVVLSFL